MSNKPTRTIATQIGGWYPVPKILTEKYGMVVANIFGCVWSYCQMHDKVCRASMSTIAKDLGIHRETVLLGVHQLCKDGYLKDLTPSLQGRPHIYINTGKLEIVAGIWTKVNEYVDEPVGETDNSVVGDSDNYPNNGNEPVGDSDRGVGDSDRVVSEIPTPPVGDSDISKTLNKTLLIRGINKSGESAGISTGAGPPGENSNGNGLHAHFPGSSFTPESAWEAVVRQLQFEMPKRSFDRWLRDTKPLTYCDGVLVVAASNSDARDCLEDRLTSTVARLLAGMCNTPIDVKWIVNE